MILYVLKAIDKRLFPTCWILGSRNILTHRFKDAWVFETGMEKQFLWDKNYSEL